MYKFRILAGKHIGIDPATGQLRTWRARHPEDDKQEQETANSDNPYKFGNNDVIETEQDLAKMYNVKGFPDKFQRLNAFGVPEGSPLSDLQPKEGESKDAYLARMAQTYDTTVMNTNESVHPDHVANNVQKAAEEGFYGQGGKPQGPPPKNNPELDGMNITELKNLAEEEEINIAGLKNKDDLVRVIRESLRQKQKNHLALAH